MIKYEPTKEINKEEIEKEFPECVNCEAWSGTDCIRHPYEEGCLLDK